MPNSISAGSGEFVLNGKPVGVVDGCSWDEQIDQRAIRKLGSLYTVEHNATGVSVSVQATLTRFYLQSLRAQGVYPSHKGTPLQGTLSVINFPPMTLNIYDNATEAVILTVTGVVPTSQGWQLNDGSVMQGSCSYLGIRTLDEQES